jgi:phosphoesterase RecJ-like protein
MYINKNEFNTISNIIKLINNSKTFFIAGHIRHDGDSLGSALAITSLLNRLNKQACLYSIDEIPPAFNFLKGQNKIRQTTKEFGTFDCAILLEVSNLTRLGNIVTYKQLKNIINIDHHTNCNYIGDVNYIMPSSGSTAELCFKIFEQMKIKLTKNEAECLYTGILTDTGCFQHLNTTIQSHIACAKLMKYNININNIYKTIYANKNINYLKLLGLALSNIKLVMNNKLAYIVLKQSMFENTNTTHQDSHGIIDYTLKIHNVRIGCVFEEITSLATKISYRSVGNINILDIAKKFNGGGHIHAAGCIIKTNLTDSIKLVLDYIKNKLENL